MAITYQLDGEMEGTILGWVVTSVEVPSTVIKHGRTSQLGGELEGTILCWVVTSVEVPSTVIRHEV